MLVRYGKKLVMMKIKDEMRMKNIIEQKVDQYTQLMINKRFFRVKCGNESCLRLKSPLLKGEIEPIPPLVKGDKGGF